MFPGGCGGGCYLESSQKDSIKKCCLGFNLPAWRRAFLQSSVRVVKFCRSLSFSSLGCGVVLMEQMPECGWSTVWGAAQHTAEGLQKCVTGGYTHAGVWLRHACYWTWRLKEGWLWATSANPRVWEVSFRKMVRTLQTLSGLDGSSLLQYMLCRILCEFL